MTLRRILKVYVAQNVTQFLTVLTQLVLPPLFLHVFGTSLYGQWLTLSAAVSYISTLNYGVQTYTNMQMTIHYNRGEIRACQEVQSAGFRIILSAFLMWTLLLCTIFLMPLDHWLHLTMPLRSAQWALYFLGMQIMAITVFSFFSLSYMVFGETHRGTHIGNANYLLGLAATVTCVILRLPFGAIASAQVVITLLLTIYLYFDLAHRAPLLRATLRYWPPGSFSAIVKPSAQYTLLAANAFFSYQFPIVFMQRILGPSAVVVYSLTRTIYSMSRRSLNLITNSLGPEVTLIYGQRDWRRLHRLYDLSERVILLLVPPITFGFMLATPLLLWVWLHKGNLYDPGISIMLGVAVSIIGIKEHKYQFQFSSNQIGRLSYFTFFSYVFMAILSIPAMYAFGVLGFLSVLLICETIQLLYLLHLNDLLFGDEAVADHRGVYKLFVILAGGTAAIYWPMYHIASLPYTAQGAIAFAASIAFFALGYWVFRLDEVRGILWEKVEGRIPALAAWRK